MRAIYMLEPSGPQDTVYECPKCRAQLGNEQRDCPKCGHLDRHPRDPAKKLLGFHPYRRKWATERKHLPVKDVAAATYSAWWLRQGSALLLAGLGIGMLLAFLATRLLGALLLNVSPTDPVTFIAVSLLLGAVALLASYLPARRATRADPLAVLRTE